MNYKNLNELYQIMGNNFASNPNQTLDQYLATVAPTSNAALVINFLKDNGVSGSLKISTLIYSEQYGNLISDAIKLVNSIIATERFNSISNEYSDYVDPKIFDNFTTGGTYNSGTEELQFVGTSSATTFNVDVSALLDDTNTFTTGATLNGNTIEFDRNDLNNAYSVDLTPIISGGGLEGTQYVFVAANGTDVENAAELQAAYDLAKTKKQVNNVWISLNSPSFNVSGGGSISAFLNSTTTIPWVNGQTYTIRLDGVEYTGVDAGSSGPFLQMSSITAPDGQYTTMEVLVQEVIPSRVIVAPGYYNFTSNFLVDEDYVDIVSLDGNRSVIFNGSGTINITANDVFVKGVDVLTKNFTIATNLGGLRVENCQGGDYSFGGDPTFGSNPIIVSGTFIDCQGGVYSFGGLGTASGTFTNCVGGNNSFGGQGTASGTFIDCQGGNNSFGFQGTASGTFTNCVGGNNSFGGNGGTASGTFTDCQGGGGSFGGTASGIFNYCQGGNLSFGGTLSGTLSGKLYYCRLTSGTFKTVSGGGITRYCLDGSNVANNQG
jgi:hypothetical protein